MPSPKLDAEHLLAHVLGVPRLELYLDHDRAARAGRGRRLRELVRRRGRREPLAYVLGSWSFYGLELHCDARALVPRPETEVLVERCLALLAGSAAPAIVDVGTGTGAIALALAARLPDAQRDGDRPLAGCAGAGARERRRCNGLADRVELLAGRPARSGGRTRASTSSPRTRRTSRPGETVDPEVADYEPALAVYADDGGRAILERLAPRRAADALSPGGHLVVEVAEGQAPWLAEHLAGLGYAAIAVTRDLRGIERVVEAVAPSPDPARRNRVGA